MRDFLFGHTGVWSWELWISSPALYHCTKVTSDFHLWQFQVFNFGAEGLVVVLIWLDLWDVCFLATLGFEPRTSAYLVFHSTTAPPQLLFFTCDNFRYLTLVQRDWWWYCSDWTCERFLFGHTGVWTWDLLISSPAFYHCATTTSGFHLWQFQVFNFGAEGLVVVLIWLDLWEICFLATLGFEPRTSGYLVLHSTTAPPQLLFFTCDNFRYLTLVQRDWWWYCSDWTCERFLFGHTGFWTWDLLISSPAFYHCAMATSGFHLWQFQVFNSGAEGLVVVLFWLWEIFFLATLRFEPRTSGSLVLHSTIVPWWLLFLTSDNFRYLTLVQRDWWLYCSDWTCERFSFWPH